MFDRRSRALAALLAISGLCELGCRFRGLPPERPDTDASNADAPVPAYEPSPDPLEASAFVGDNVESGGHDHAQHGRRAP